MIIEELKYTPGKTVIKFRNDLADPHLKTATVKTLGEIDRSHIIEAAEHVILLQKKAYAEQLEAEENQGKLDFEGEKTEAGEEGNVASEEVKEEDESVEFEEPKAKDWSQEAIPYHSGAPSIPDFRSMVKEHACFVIDNRYGDDEDEFIYGFEELKQDMQYNGYKLSQRTLSTSKERAKALILGQ